MEHRPPELMAEIVISIYNKEFRGKTRGRFALTRDQIKEISGRSRLEESIIKQFTDCLIKQGYCLVKIDGSLFAVIDQNILSNYRKLTKNIMRQVIKEYSIA